MTIPLTEFANTISVGGFLITGLLLINYLFELLRPEWFNLIKPHLKGPLAAGITILILFICGMISEDISNKFVDDGSGRIAILPSESKLRYEVLKESKLGIRYAENGLFAKIGGENGLQLEKSILSNRKIPSYRESRDTFDRTYYHAKNTVYLKSNFYNELSRIQSRIDLSRSIALISLFLFTGVLVGALLASLKTAFTRVENDEWKPSFKRKSLRCILGRMICFIIPLIVVYGACRIAFESEEKEFNKRVFGYFYTLDESNEKSNVKTASFIEKETQTSGISGICREIGTRNSFLVIHDLKSNESGARISRVTQSPADNKDIRQPMQISWPNAKLASDLEAICPIPETTNLYLIVESSHYLPAKTKARLMILKVNKSPSNISGTIVNWVDLPANYISKKLEVEGMCCITKEADRITLILGERNTGSLDSYTWELNTNRLTKLGSLTVNIANVDKHFRNHNYRRITDLNLVRNQKGKPIEIWGVAAFDGGDRGPFASVVYKINFDELGIQSLSQSTSKTAIGNITHKIDGFKVEGVCEGHTNNLILIASDDELQGGVIRPLLK